ncbi:hypothetical protein RRG08_053446 [Elysia crispata]|uniref:Uncharacterized protein n=1 Tax=Elysia crispata TaxID=231223 RepID=A0AAE0ZFJ2_9GAST|nr:hypothetical protein RRG08_053446 [Elysia crispata]
MSRDLILQATWRANGLWIKSSPRCLQAILMKGSKQGVMFEDKQWPALSTLKMMLTSAKLAMACHAPLSKFLCTPGVINGVVKVFYIRVPSLCGLVHSSNETERSF